MTKPKILCVDDEQTTRELFRSLLEDEFEVLTAEDGTKGLELFRNIPGIAIVVADQRMPGMTGVTLLQQILLINPDTIRIILTGHPDVRDLISAVNEGNIYKYFIKPYPTDELRQSLRRALQIYYLTQEKKRLIQKLSQKNEELKKTNLILQGVIEHNQKIQERMREDVSNNINGILAPLLCELKSTNLEGRQRVLLARIEECIDSVARHIPRKLCRCQFSLTPVEIQVVNHIISGKSTKEITQSLQLSNRTVETHRYNIRKKLGLHNRKVNLQSHLLSLE